MRSSCASSICDLCGIKHWAGILFFFLHGAALCQVSDDVPEHYVVNGIVVEGVKATKERVVTRELTVHLGDTLGRDALYAELERSRQNLQNLGIFNKVMVLPMFVSGSDILIQVVVDERWYLWPVPIFQFAETNFNTWWLTKDFSRTNYGGYLYWYNFTGNNDRLYAKFQFGYTKQFAAEYRSGYLDDAGKWAFKSGMSYAQNAEITFGTKDNKRLFYSPNSGNSREVNKVYTDIIYRRAYDTRHTVSFIYTDANVLDTVPQQNVDYFLPGQTSAGFFSFQYRFVLDRRDETRFTRDGHLLSLTVRQDGLGFTTGDAVNLTSAYAKAIYWWRLNNDLSVSTSGRYKKTFQSQVPYYLQQGLGYDDFVRGYEFYVIDGQDYALFKQNFHFPIIKPFEQRIEQVPLEAFRSFYFAAYLNLYFDVGYVWDDLYADQNFLDNELMYGYGLGLDLVTSYDRTLRMEYSFNRRSESGFFLHFKLPF